jgi:hypothetical protein
VVVDLEALGFLFLFGAVDLGAGQLLVEFGDRKEF